MSALDDEPAIVKVPVLERGARMLTYPNARFESYMIAVVLAADTAETCARWLTGVVPGLRLGYIWT